MLVTDILSRQEVETDVFRFQVEAVAKSGSRGVGHRPWVPDRSICPARTFFEQTVEKFC